nr:hypothetical protein [Tanacetum cinerariifolium]
MTIFNENCDNYIYGDGKPIICTACGSMVMGGLCLTCDFREKNLYNCDPNAYSFDNTNYFPQSQYKNHLCNLCGNNSHNGYDCQQQFPFVHEQELSYNQNYEEPSQESDIHQLIEECSAEVSEKQKMEDTMLELVKICQEKEFLCIHDDIDDLIEKYDQSTGTYHPIFLNDNEDHPRESSENSFEENVVSKTNQEPPQDSNIHQLIEECCEEVPEEQKQNMEKTMLDLEQEVKNIEEQPAEEVEDISQVQDVVLREKLFNITRLISNIESLNDNSTPDQEVDLFLFDDSIPPGIENFADDPEGDIHFLEELLIDDPILSHESSDSNFEDNPSISRPPPEPLDDNFDLEPEVISAVMEDNDEPDEYFNPGGEIFVSTNNEDVDYFPFMFVIRIFLPYLILPDISPLFPSAESEDTIFDPGLSLEIEVILCWIYVRFPSSSYPLIDFSLGRSISF